jgi:hypothetical protein
MGTKVAVDLTGIIRFNGAHSDAGFEAVGLI